MSLSSEANRLMGDYRSAQAARLAELAEIADAVERERERTRSFLRRTRAELTTSVEGQLKGIFSEAAFIRGAANDLIERFAGEREQKAECLRMELADAVARIQDGVGQRLTDLATGRAAEARRGRAARQDYLDGLQRAVQAVLSDTDRVVSDLTQDRMRSAQIWRRQSERQDDT